MGSGRREGARRKKKSAKNLRSPPPLSLSLFPSHDDVVVAQASKSTSSSFNFSSEERSSDKGCKEEEGGRGGRRDRKELLQGRRFIWGPHSADGDARNVDPSTAFGRDADPKCGAGNKSLYVVGKRSFLLLLCLAPPGSCLTSSVNLYWAVYTAKLRARRSLSSVDGLTRPPRAKRGRRDRRERGREGEGEGASFRCLPPEWHTR